MFFTSGSRVRLAVGKYVGGGRRNIRRRYAIDDNNNNKATKGVYGVNNAQWLNIMDLTYRSALGGAIQAHIFIYICVCECVRARACVRACVYMCV